MADTARWHAVLTRDARSTNLFVYCVKTTRIYCRPTCSARLARRTNVEFRDTPAAAESGGYRACKRCRPQTASLTLEPGSEGEGEGIRRVCRYLDGLRSDAALPRLEVMAGQAGLSKCHFHRMFRRVMGVTPREYAIEARGRSREASVVLMPPLGQGGGCGDVRTEWQESAPRVNPLSLEQRPGCRYFATTRTSFGLLLVVFNGLRMCRLQLCEDAAEVGVALEREAAAQANMYQCLDLESNTDAELYRRQVGLVVEALERPSGQVLDLAASTIC